MFWVPLAFGL
jgi:hypothetical protein